MPNLYEQTGLTEQETSTLPQDSIEYQVYQSVQSGKLKMPEEESNNFSNNITFNSYKQGGPGTGDTVSVTESTKNKWENQIAALIEKDLCIHSKWVKITSMSSFCSEYAGKALKIMGKEGDLLLLDHAHPESDIGLGIFSHSSGAGGLAKVLKKASQHSGNEIKSVQLLGCEVSPKFAQELATHLQKPVRTLRPFPNSFLEIKPDGMFRYFIDSCNERLILVTVSLSKAVYRK